MLHVLSFNKCSISALAAPLYQSVEEKLNLTSTPFKIAVYVTNYLSDTNRSNMYRRRNYNTIIGKITCALSSQNPGK